MFIVIGSVQALNQGFKYMRYLESCQKSLMFKDFIGDNHLSSESGNIKSSALVFHISVSSLTGAILSCSS